MRQRLSAGIKKERGVFGSKRVLADRAYHSLAATCSAGATGCGFMVEEVKVFIVVHIYSVYGERSSGQAAVVRFGRPRLASSGGRLLVVVGVRSKAEIARKPDRW